MSTAISNDVTNTANAQHIDLNVVPGLNIQTTIDKIMEVSTQQVTNAQTAEQKIQTKISDWGDITSSMTTLTDDLDTLRSYDTWNNMTVTSSDTASLQATATSQADINTYAIQIAHLAQSHTIASNLASTLGGGVSKSSDDLIAAGVLTVGQQFNIGDKLFTVGAAEFGSTGGVESLNSLAGKINTAAASMADKVHAAIVDNHLVITRVATGATQLTMSDANGGTALQTLGFLNSDETLNTANVTQQAQDALFTVNGLSVTRATNTNLTDVVQNVTMSLKAPTGSDTLTLDIARDTATPKAAIETFIKDYNAAVTKMQAYTAVTLNGSSAPTVGDLQNDSMVFEMLTSLRSLATGSKDAFFGGVDSSYTYNGLTGNMTSLSAIGVGTKGKENQLAITDATRLDSVLSTNFDKVAQLFRGVATPGVGYAHGVAGDFYNYGYKLTTPMSGDIAKHVFALQKQDQTALDAIIKMQNDMTAQETSLWAQFTAMQDAISQMKSDTSWISSSSSSSSG